MLTNGVLNYLLIPHYGIEGAAFTSLITIVLMNIIRLLLVYRNHGFIPYNKDYYKVILGALASTLLIYLISKFIIIHYILKLFIALGIYLITFISINFLLGISSEDNLVLGKVLQKLNSRFSGREENERNYTKK
jgi:O-antigen/teichoic acid export membrane protein